MADTLLGSFVWCELMTTDAAAADAFYRKVVGWTTVPFAPDGSYSVFNNPAGGGAAGLMKLPDAAKQAGTPPNWMMYVGTPNVDATALRIAQLGGRVLKQPENIPNTGRFAVVQDPFGATFGIYAPSNPGAGKDSPELGDFSWFELYTPDPERAWNFYQSLFGWEQTSAMDMGELGTYQMFGRGGIPRGGIMKPPPGAPAAWMPYAMVRDAKAAAAAATSSGGKIVTGPMEVPGGDWIAVGIDPQGAMFAVHSLNPGAANRAPEAGKSRKTNPSAKKNASAKKTKPVKRSKPVRKSKPVKKSKPIKKSKPAKQSKPAKKTAAKKAKTLTPARKAAKRKK